MVQLQDRVLFALSLFLLFALLGAGVAKADGSSMLLFTLTGPVDATFELSNNPFVDPGNVDPGFGFLVNPVDLTINGLASDDILAFYASSGGGGLAAFDASWDPDFSLYGDKLYKGPEWNPKFGPSGDPISLTDENGVGYTLTVTTVATPEPSSLLLLAVGLLPLALLLRRSM